VATTTASSITHHLPDGGIEWHGGDWVRAPGVNMPDADGTVTTAGQQQRSSHRKGPYLVAAMRLFNVGHRGEDEPSAWLWSLLVGGSAGCSLVSRMYPS